MYNYNLQPDTSILQEDQTSTREAEDLPVLQEDVEAAVRSLKTGKSPSADNVPSELLKHGGEETTKALTALCQKIWESKEWRKEWTRSLELPLPKKGNLRQCQNYRTISLIIISIIIIIIIITCTKESYNVLMQS